MGALCLCWDLTLHTPYTPSYYRPTFICHLKLDLRNTQVPHWAAQSIQHPLWATVGLMHDAFKYKCMKLSNFF